MNTPRDTTMKSFQRLQYRTVWISDTHLGSKGCRAKDLSQFLKHIRCDTLFLVGDIIDTWRLRQRWYWPSEHNAVIRRILKLANRGTKVVYVPGNHDDVARQYHGLDFGGVEILRHTEHLTLDGKRLFICHGDQYDLVVQHSPFLSKLGGRAYETLLVINRLYNQGRAIFGMPYVSLSQAVKGKVKRACTFISRFEEHLVGEARGRGYDGVVCGHIHKAEQRMFHAEPGEDTHDVLYLNSGDWVESCTAVVEHHDGRIEVVNGLELINSLDSISKARGGQADHDQEELDDHDDDILDPAGILPPGVIERVRPDFNDILGSAKGDGDGAARRNGNGPDHGRD